MPLLKNPYTNQIPQNVTEARAAELRRRGWVDVETPPAVQTPDLVEEMAAGLAEARDQAEWLVAEARWERDQAQAKLAEVPGADALELASDQLTNAHERVEQLEEAAGQLVQERDDLTRRVEELEAEATKPDEGTKPDEPAKTPAKAPAGRKPAAK